jgi:hypothetical protein
VGFIVGESEGDLVGSLVGEGVGLAFQDAQRSALDRCFGSTQLHAVPFSLH